MVYEGYSICGKWLCVCYVHLFHLGIPGDFGVHQTLLQGIGQPLVYQRVADEGSTLTQ